jgi:AAA domain
VAIELQIRWIRIRVPDGWQAPYNLDAPVVAIVGEVDTGKTSLLDCIAYALGRDIAEFAGAVDRQLREVEVGVKFPQGTYILRRARSSSGHVEVFDEAGTALGRFPTRSKDAQLTISEWILTELDLVETFTSVRLKRAKPLDFAESLLAYCYLTQADIDRHIVRDPKDNEERLAVLKLLLNLTTGEFERLSGEIHENELEVTRILKRADTVRDFLGESQATDRHAVADELDRLRTALDVAEQARAAAAANARGASQFADTLRRRVEEARRAVGQAEIQLDKMRTKRDGVLARIEQAEEGLAKLNELEKLSPDDRPDLALALDHCVVCTASLSDIPREPGTCYMCGSLLAGHEHSKQRQQLNIVYQNAATALNEANQAVKDADDEAAEKRRSLKQLAEQLDDDTRESVTPFVDTIAANSAEVADIRARLDALGRLQQAHDRLAEQYQHIEVLKRRQDERRAQLDLIAGDVRDVDEVVGEITEIFRRIVKSIGLPHATGRARIDPETLLPLVDDQTFTQRGGGARSAVSIAYSLALLTYTLERATAAVPSLLIIDSPQKNFGSNRNDKQLAHRVYERFLDLMEERREWGAGEFARPYQLIIVDNDIHTDVAKRIKVHRFTREQGFIRDLVDPHGPTEADQLSLDDLDEDVD